MPRVAALALLASLALVVLDVLGACSSSKGSPAGATSGGDGGSLPSDGSSGEAASGDDATATTYTQFQVHNLDVLNQYRATLGIAPLVLDHALSAFALAGSQELSTDHTPHQHIIDAINDNTIQQDGFGDQLAENQGNPDGWQKLAIDPTTNELDQVDATLEYMFNEGAGDGEAHDHYTNLMNPAYTRVGVGLLEVQGLLYLTNDFSD